MSQEKKNKTETACEEEISEETVQAETSAAAESETETLRREAEDFKRKWYSVTAEYENYRKRTASTRSQAYAEGRADVVKGLFPIADNLELAIASCTEEKTKQAQRLRFYHFGLERGSEVVLGHSYLVLEVSRGS